MKKKLVLKKETISNLEDRQMNRIIAGGSNAPTNCNLEQTAATQCNYPTFCFPTCGAGLGQKTRNAACPTYSCLQCETDVAPCVTYTCPPDK